MHSLLITLALVLAADKDRLPVSLGEYQYLLGGKRIGEEQFRVFKMDGYRIESTRSLYWPEPSRQEMRYELEPSFEPKKLSLVTTRAGIVTELELSRQGENWRSEVKGQGRDKKKHELGRRAGAIVDFDSLVFNALALKKLVLAAGEAKSVEAITLTLPDFAGARASQTYRRVEQEIETEFAGSSRRRYTSSLPERRSTACRSRPPGSWWGVFEHSAGTGSAARASQTKPGAWPPRFRFRPAHSRLTVGRSIYSGRRCRLPV
jgi:hypothetical protein